MTGSATLAARDIVRSHHTYGDAGSGRARYGLWLGAALLIVAAAVVGSQLRSGTARSGRARSAARIEPARAARAHAVDHLLPAAAAGVVSRSIGHDEPAYALRSVAGGFAADSVAQHLAARFLSNGVRVSSHGTRLSMSLAGYGRAGSLRPVAPATPVAGANEVTYRHSGLREWYANGPVGLEQGFVLGSSPGPRTGEPVELSLAVGGSGRATLAHGAVTFHGPHAGAISYRNLVVTDATGRRLPAHLALRNGRVVISVDDHDAQYPIRVDPLIESASLTDSDGNGANDNFGWSVAVDGDTIVVGAPDAEVGSNRDQGALYVFVKPDSGWVDATETARLVDSSASVSGSEQLGLGVAISGDTIVGGTYNQALVFVKPAGGWSDSTPVAAYLTDSNTQGTGIGPFVAIDRNTIVLGAPYEHNYTGQLDVYTEPSGGWTNATPTATLTATDAPDHLGWTVAISGDTIVGGSLSGAAYVYTEPTGGWTNNNQTAELAATDADNSYGYSSFGQVVAVSGNTVAVAAPNRPDGAEANAGAIYVYTRPAGGWTNAAQPAELTNSDSGNYDALGTSLAITGDTIVGGAPEAGGDAQPGALEEFTKPAGGWVNDADPQILTVNDPNDIDLGRAVAFDGGTLVGTSNGSYPTAYVWTASPEPPAITSTASTTDTMRTAFDFPVTTTGSPAPTLSETGPLPTGVTFTDNGDGTADLAGTPAVGTAGNYPITITASNGSGPDATQSFVLTISAAKTVPAFTSADSDTVAYGSAFSFTVTTSGNPVPKITNSGSAPGVKFTDNGDGTATISGTPTGSASGPYTLALTAKSSAGSATQNFTLTVTRAPTLANIKNVTAIVGNPLNVAVAAPAGYPAPSVTESGALPTGVQFTVNPNGSSTFSGTPSSGSGGTYQITVTATNASGTAARSFVLTVEQAPAFTSANRDSVSVGSPFTFQVMASGSPTPKITESGSLPSGVKWNTSSATLSGTPKKGTAGNYQLTFTATNKAGTQAQQFTLTVS